MLYNSERPVNFNELKGQDINKEIFCKQISENKYSSAYLFAGHHGSGKTTSARILAKSAICERPTAYGPCNECECCINFEKSVDIVEIDAASNTGVDTVRENIIEAARYAPVQMKRKRFIIDEVHMLSTSAFNALLKILEEPQEYLMFFLCTTELHKVPKTIVSRCQKFNFNGISAELIEKSLIEISQKNGIQIEHAAINVIAKAADGSMRDALSILEQASSEGYVSVGEVNNMLGMTDVASVDNILENIHQKNVKGIIDGVDYFMKNSNINYLIELLLERIVENASNGNEMFLPLIDKIIILNGKNTTVTSLKAILINFSDKFSLRQKVEELEKKVNSIIDGQVDINVAEKNKEISSSNDVLEQETAPKKDCFIEDNIPIEQNQITETENKSVEFNTNVENEHEHIKKLSPFEW